jgi:hypothetical protein
MDGMSLRDYFAAKAQQVWLEAVLRGDVQDKGPDEVAALAYGAADAMLKARENA